MTVRSRTQTRAIRCQRCNTRLADPSRRVYSTFTKSHYCADVNGCDRRAKRAKKQVV